MLSFALPYDFHSRGTLHLLLLPETFIPVKIKEHDDERRDFLQVFLHPVALHDPLWDVPFIRGSLGIDACNKQIGINIYCTVTLRLQTEKCHASTVQEYCTAPHTP